MLFIFYATQGILDLLCKLNSKQSAKVICKFDRLIEQHTARDKEAM